MSQSIGAVQAIGVYRRLTWLRLRRGWQRWVALILLAVPVIAAVVMLLVSKFGDSGGSVSVDLFHSIMQFHLHLLVLFLPALATSSIVAEEIDSKTFTFLFARPAARWTMPVGKYLAAILPLSGLFAVSITLTYLVALLPSGMGDFVEYLPHLGRAIIAAVVGVMAVGAMAAMLGAWFTRYPVIMVIMTLGLLKLLSLAISVAELSWHVRNLARTERARLVFAELDVPPWVSAAVLLGVGLLCLLGAATSVNGGEYRSDR